MKRKIKEKIYYAKEGAPFGDDAAQKIGEYLELKNLDSAEKILNDAKNKDSTLHKYFEWDKAKAAYAYQKWQANYIINHLEAEIVYDDGKTEYYARGFEMVFENDNGQNKGYMRIDKIVGEGKFRNQVIEKGWKNYLVWQSRYVNYGEFKKIFTAAEEVKKDLKKKKIIV